MNSQASTLNPTNTNATFNSYASKILFTFLLFLGITALNANAQRTVDYSNTKPTLTLVSGAVAQGQAVELVYTHVRTNTVKFTITTKEGTVVAEKSYRLEPGTHVVPMSTAAMPAGRTYFVRTLNEEGVDSGQQSFYVY